MLLSFGLLAAVFIYFTAKGGKEALKSHETGGEAAAVNVPAARFEPGEPPLPERQDAAPPSLRIVDNAIKEGDLDKALGLLRAAIENERESLELRSVLARLLNRIAHREFSSGRYEVAKAYLKEAVELTNERVYLENLASVQIRLKDLKGAAETLESSRPEAAETKRLLKGLYIELANGGRKAQDMSFAFSYFEKALALDPSDSTLSALVAGLKSANAAEGLMTRKEAARFTVKFDGPENAVTGELIGLLLEEAYVKAGAELGYYPEERIEALLYSSERFRDITKAPAWAGALYDGRIKIPAGGLAERTAALERVILHEYTHALVHRLSGGKAPAWLNEGLAQYVEGAPMSFTPEAKRLMAAIDIASLEGGFSSLDDRSASLAYAASLSFTGHIIKEFGLFSVKKALEGLSVGLTVDEALRGSVYLSYDELKESWKRSLER